MGSLRKHVVDESAKVYATKGFLCSESVLLAIADWLGIDSELIPKIATGLGAGIGGQGMVCGAVTGGILALGLKFGRNTVKKQERKPYWFAQEFLKRFGDKWNYLTCRELTGCDFNKEADRKRYETEKMWDDKCRQYIATATSIVNDIILEKSM